MSSHSDNFNGADSGTLGIQKTWTDVAGDFTNASNAAHVNVLDTASLARCEHDLAGVDQRVTAKITAFSSQGSGHNVQAGVCARFSASAQTCYVIRVIRLTSTDDMYVTKYVAGTPTDLGTPVTLTNIALGDTIKIEVTTSGANAVIKGYHNGVEKRSETDSSSPLTTGLRHGITGYLGTGSGGSVDIDDYVAEDLGTPATAYTMTGPTAGPNGAASSNFTLTPNGTTSVTITPSDGGAGGTFTPTSLTWTGDAVAKTFTYTAASLGNKTISVTDNGSLTDPANITYASKATFTRQYSAVDGTPATTTFYTVKNNDGTVFGARTSSGVVDMGNGAYKAPSIVIPSDYLGQIQWDQGGTLFAIEDLAAPPASGAASVVSVGGGITYV